MSVKKIVYIVIILAAFILLAVFIAQNNQPVTIKFMKWEYGSQSGLIVLFSFIVGMFVGFLFWIFSLIFRKRPSKKKEMPDAGMEEEQVKEETENPKSQIPDSI